MKWVVDVLTNPISGMVVTIISVIVTLLSILLAFVVKSKKPTYSIKYNRIINRDISKYRGIQILYNGNEVDNVSESVVFFWNAGKKSIRGNDLLKDNPLRLEFPSNIMIYSIEYKTTENMRNSFSVKLDKPNILELSFDSMLKNEGVCFRILHTEYNNQHTELKGIIDDSKAIRFVEYKETRDFSRVKSVKTKGKPSETKGLVFSTIGDLFDGAFESLIAMCLIIAVFVLFIYLFIVGLIILISLFIVFSVISQLIYPVCVPKSLLEIELKNDEFIMITLDGLEEL